MELFTLFGLLAVGSLTFWAFWIVFVVFSLVMVGLTETEHWGWAFVLTGGGLAVMYGAGIFDVVSYTAHHPMSLLLKLLEYVGLGLVWGTIKWWRFVLKAKNNYLAAKDAFLADNHATELTDALKLKWSQLVKDRSAAYYSDTDRALIAEAPLARQHKEKIMNWMALWPFSVLGTLFYDFLREVWESLYEAVSGVYNLMSKAIYKDISGDVLTGAELEKAVAAANADTEFQRERNRRNQ